jgi:DNA-binding IscR family transcriptional regulator
VLYFAGEELDVLPCDRSGGDCERMSDCICHRMLTSVADMVNDYFNGVTLQTLLVNPEFRPGKKPDESSAA